MNTRLPKIKIHDIEDLYAWVIAVTKKYAKFSDKEDLRAYIVLQVLDIAQKYDIQRGAKFSTWATFYVRGVISDYFKAKEGYYTPDFPIIHENSTNILNPVNTLEYRADIMFKLVDIIAIRQCVDKLKGRQKQVVNMIYYRDMTTKEAAKELGLSLSSTYKVLNSAHNSIRRIYTSTGSYIKFYHKPV